MDTDSFPAKNKRAAAVERSRAFFRRHCGSDPSFPENGLFRTPRSSSESRLFMKTKKVVEIGGVGEVLLERSRRAKHFNLTIKSVNVIRVAVPPGVSFTDAELFARSKKDWLRKHLEKIEVMAREIEDAVAVYPTDRKAARQVLVCRLNQLSEQLGLPYNKVFVKCQKTRWGSCSMANNINLNVNLVRLPQELMDYAIIHELVHTKIKNHGRRFWALLTHFLPNAAALDRELDRYWVLLGDFPGTEP